MSDTSPPAAAINYKIGNEHLIKVTENASRKLNSLLEKQGRASRALFSGAHSYTGFDIYPDDNTDVVGDAHRLSVA